MGYFQVRYNYSVVNYDRRGFIRLATAFDLIKYILEFLLYSEVRDSVSQSVLTNLLVFYSSHATMKYFYQRTSTGPPINVTRKKSPNVYKSSPKMI